MFEKEAEEYFENECLHSYADTEEQLKEVKAVVSGLYITDVKGIRGPLDAPQKKKGFLARFKK